MEQQTQTPTQPPLPPTPTYPDSWDETTNTNTFNPPPQPQKLRLLCSYGGHIVPRPHDKSLCYIVRPVKISFCYIGGDTRIVVVDRHTSLVDLTNRLTKTLIESQSSSSLASSQSVSLPPFTLKYQLPFEDLDSLISVTTDEDLENMIDEYEILNADVRKLSRLRLFLFPTIEAIHDGNLGHEVEGVSGQAPSLDDMVRDNMSSGSTRSYSRDGTPPSWNALSIRDSSTPMTESDYLQEFWWEEFDTLT